MTTNLDPSAELFLSNVDRIQRRLSEANRQVSSGKKIAQPSDAPDQIDAILQLRAGRRHNEQIRFNLAMAVTDAQAADASLTMSIRLMDRARVLAAQGGNFTIDAAARRSLAEEAQSLLEQMIAYSQTTVQGRYLFSGDQEGVPTYQADPASSSGVARLVTPASTRRIESPSGGAFVAAKTAQDIFDSRNADDTLAADNVFAALNALRTALANNDPAACLSSVTAITGASARLASVQAFYGSVQTRLKDATAFGERYDLDLQKQLGEIEDADVPAAAVELSQGNTQLQAAFQMRALMPRQSLFDFLG
jgi:flagellar hook-associated protein 3 FlgL